MMHGFLANNRDELTQRRRTKVEAKAGRFASDVQLE